MFYGVIVDPTTLASGARSAWVGAEDMHVGEAYKGISKLKKSITFANVWAAEADKLHTWQESRNERSGQTQHMRLCAVRCRRAAAVLPPCVLPSPLRMP